LKRKKSHKESTKKKALKKKKRIYKSQWFTPVILATWEAEMRGPWIKASQGTVCETPSPK
jgi:hypothetical protein